MSPTAKWFLRISIGVFLLFVAIPLVVIWFNYSAQWAWERYAEQLRKEGHPVELSEVVPPEIADAENRVGTPFWHDLFDAQNSEAVINQHWPGLIGEAQTWVKDYEVAQRDGTKPYTVWNQIDLRPWALALMTVENEREMTPPTKEEVEALSPAKAASLVLQHLEASEPLLQEIREAADRPKARYPVRYKTPNPANIPLPHLRMVKELVRNLQFRVLAHAARGDWEQAEAELDLMFSMADTLRGEPMLISFLVRVASLRLVMDTFRQASAIGPGWSREMLARWQARWEELDLLHEVRQTLAGERAFGNGIFSFLRTPGGPKSFLGFQAGNPGAGAVDWLGALPKGWLYREQLNYNRLLDEHYALTNADPRLPLTPREIDRRLDRLEKETRQLGIAAIWKQRVFAGLLLPALRKVYLRAAQAQAYVDMAALASELQRHHLAEQAYPPSLSDLVPRYLEAVPQDVVGQQPYRYKRGGPHPFLLWSVGWNMTDDNAREEQDAAKGDWVWVQPASPPWADASP